MKTEQQQGSGSKAQHTQGEWDIFPSPEYVCIGVFQPHSNLVKEVCAIQRAANRADAWADARLIAAAPEMLEALNLALATIERLAPSHRGFDSTRGTKEVICAAIAKAEGRA